MGIVVLIFGMVLLFVIIWWFAHSWIYQDIWSIGIYTGRNPWTLAPHPSTRLRPVLSAADVSDAKALFVADPFLVDDQRNRWYMFFEIFNSDSNRGELAYAQSADGLDWVYGQVIIKEQFHLSYPQVFEDRGTYYMIPETAEAKSVRLYRAVAFPEHWEFTGELLSGNYLDPTVLFHKNLWWLFSLRDNSALTLHFSESLEGPWHEHPTSPISTDKRFIRPAGRIVRCENRLIRFTQDGTITYGQSVNAWEIMELTRDCYLERPMQTHPIICASGSDWNAHGMHHIDAQLDAQGTWLAAVDGKLIHRRFLWRKGARAIMNLLDFVASRN